MELTLRDDFTCSRVKNRYHTNQLITYMNSFVAISLLTNFLADASFHISWYGSMSQGNVCNVFKTN